MSRTSERRLALACTLLTGITLLSWWIGTRGGPQSFRPDIAITVGVLLMAILKVRVIAWEFMELRAAPRLLRRVADAWLALLTLLLLGVYLVGLH